MDDLEKRIEKLERRAYRNWFLRAGETWLMWFVVNVAIYAIIFIIGLLVGVSAATGYGAGL